MDTKIIGIILLICSALLFQYGYEDFREAFFSPSKKLSVAIERTIEKPTAIKKDTTNNIHHVKIKYRSEDAYQLLRKNPPKFETNEKGTQWLEIEILDLPDETNPGFITQVSIFDLKTNNKIGEYGSTFMLKDFEPNLILAKKEKIEPVDLKIKNNNK